jgi:hypothetical protein
MIGVSSCSVGPVPPTFLYNQHPSQTWTAGLRRRIGLLKKRKNAKRNLQKCTNVYIANTDKDCDLLQDRLILLSERIPHDKTTNVF